MILADREALALFVTFFLPLPIDANNFCCERKDRVLRCEVKVHMQVSYGFDICNRNPFRAKQGKGR